MPSENRAPLPVSLSRRRLVRMTTVDSTLHALRDSIVMGDSPPGTPLVEGAVAEALGVSRNTVREAFRMLAADGLLTYQPHHGFIVTQLTLDDVHDIFFIRKVFESEAVLRARIDAPAGLERMNSALSDLRRVIDTEDRLASVATDLQFHQCLVDLLDSRRASDIFRNLVLGLRLALSIVDRDLDTPQDRAAMVADNEEISALLAQNRRKRCANVLLRHLTEAEAKVCRTLTRAEAPRRVRASPALIRRAARSPAPL